MAADAVPAVAGAAVNRQYFCCYQKCKKGEPALWLVRLFYFSHMQGPIAFQV